MNYYCVRREFLINDREQTRVKSIAPPNGGNAHIGHIRSEGVSRRESDVLFSQSYDAAKKNDDTFDFYLAVPEEDLEEFGVPFCRMVERRMNLKPCLAIRDMPLGGAKYETMAETLENKCGGKVVFVVSKHFPTSDECQFLVHFAKTLDPDAKCARLIPLEIDKNVRLPRVLEGLCKIHYNAAVRENWLGERLWLAIKGGQRRRCLSSTSP